MNLIENIRTAFSSIISNKMRSILTMLGIIIGISAVITITTLGTTLRSTIKGAFSSLGANYFWVNVYPRSEDENYYSVDDAITVEMLKDLVNKYPDEFYIANSMGFSSGTVMNEQGKNVKVNAEGVFDGTIKGNFKLLYGRNITMRDNDEKRFSVVVSDIFVDQYFEKGDEVLGSQINIDFENGESFLFYIVGVYKYSPLKQGRINMAKKDEIETQIFIPYMVANEYSPESRKEDYFYSADIIWNTSKDHDIVYNHIEKFFEEEYALNKNFYADIYDAQDDVSIIDKVINIVTIVVSIIAAISLIVGGVGVMNIMLVSVTERTREIGIRKALGAKSSTIKFQFVTEAIIICLIGGIIGITIGIINGEFVGLVANLFLSSDSELVEMLGKVTVVPSISAILVSIIFSLMTGVFFGWYPAKKAANMNPIDALRYD